MRISVLLNVFLSIPALFIGTIVNAQNVGINATGSTPNVSAGLDIDFTNKGMLVPRVALTGTADVTTIATPATSLLIYNTATAGTSPNNVTPGFYYYSGTAWVKLAIASGSSNDWTTTGNTGTTPGTNFIGTTDAKDVVFKTNGVENMRLESGGNLGLATNNPEEKLHVSNNGGGNILMDKDVRLKSQRVSPAADFNLIGFGGAYDELEIGEWTNEINTMIVKVPLADNFTNDDGSIEFRDNTNPVSLLKLQEDHKSGINTDAPEDLFHIGGGDGNMLLDKDVRIKSQRATPAPEFNLIGFGSMFNEMEIGEWTNEINAMIIKVPLADNFTNNDGSIEFRDNSVPEPLIRLQEDHKFGLNTNAPEDLFHIGGGSGNMLLDKDVRIKSQRAVPAPEFNLLGFGSMFNEMEIGEWTNEINAMVIKVPLADNFTNDDGAIKFMDNSSGNSLLRLQEDHKIGINTDSPQELLHVNGKVKIGAYTLPDTDGTSGQVLTTSGSGVVSWASSSNTSWGLTGNTGTNPATNFIGTTDNTDFVARTNNTERLRILANGNVGIGNNAPVYKLQVESNTHNYTGYFANNNTSNTGNVGVFGNCYGNAAGTNAGVQGRGYNGNPATTTTYGVMGSSQSNYGIGRAVAGFAWDSPTTVGVYGASFAQSGVTINSYGLQGSAGGSATNHYGVYGEAIGSGTTVYGVYGRASGSSTTAYAIYGRENSPTAVTGYGTFSEAIGTGATTNYGIYATASGAVTNWAGYFVGNSYISGNVGIGTTTPTTKLEVTGQIKITGGTPGAGKVLVSDATGLASWQTVAGVGGQWLLTGNAGTSAATNFIGTTDAIDFVTRTNNTEQMRITSAGNVGIGITNPTQKLDVVGNIYANSGQYKVFNSTNDLYRGSLGKYGSANGFDFNSVSATNGIALENGDTESGGFYADGDMVGIWSPGDNDILKLWDEDGMILRSRLDNTGTWFALAFTATSDERMKKNIRQLPDSSLQKIMQLNGKIYDWREEILFKGEIEAGKEIPYDQLKNKIGFIAQELELVFPELVETNKTTGYKAVNYDGMIPVLVEGMKEQQAQIDELKQQNELLLKELQEMRTALKLKLEEK